MSARWLQTSAWAAAVASLNITGACSEPRLAMQPVATRADLAAVDANALGDATDSEGLVEGGSDNGQPDADSDENASDLPISPTACAAGCDDGNQCTDDTCDSVAGCIHVPLAEETTCLMSSDPSAGVCKQGLCKPDCPLAYAEFPTLDALLIESTKAKPAIGGSLLPLDDGFVLVGSTLIPGPKNGSVSAGQFIRLDKKGNVLVMATYPPKTVEGSYFVGITQALPAGNGFVLQGRDFLMGVNKDGEKLWVQKYDDVGATIYDLPHIFDIVQLADGYALVGELGALTARKINWGCVWTQQWLARTDLAGKILWSGKGGFGVFYRAVAAGGKLFVQASQESCGDDLPSYLDDMTIVIDWQSYKQDMVGWAGKFPADLATEGTDVVVAYEEPWDAFLGELRLERRDLKGNLIWTHSYGKGTFPHLAKAVGGGFAVVADDGNGSTRFIRVDALGNPMWEKASLPGDRASAILALPNGFAILGKKAGGGNKGIVWFQRTDAWGNTTCADSGVCSALTAADCDDGDPCTADDCDKVKGCVHKTFPDGSLCGTGKTCQAGICG